MDIEPLRKPKDRKAMTRSKREGFAKEKDLQSLCEQYLTALNIPFLHLPAYALNASFRRHNASGAELGAARAASEYIKGFPDIVAFFGGKYKAWELKSKTGTMSQSQRQWKKEIGTEEIRTFEQFEKSVNEWMG